MSLSKPNQFTPSPVKRYITWNGTEGNISYYDKDTATKQTINLPLSFIPIDQFSLVEGFNAKAGNGFRSNEVKSTTKEDLIVKWNGGSTIIQGKYKDIKDKITNLGGKFNASIYCVVDINGHREICNLKLKGAGLSTWLDIQKKISSSIEGNVVTITKSDIQKTGNVSYYTPVFTLSKATEKQHTEAVELDSHLQNYISGRGSSVDLEAMEIPVLTEVEQSSFNKMKAAGFTQKTVKSPKQSIEEQSQDDFFTEGFN